jgi:hypothetical protein
MIRSSRSFAALGVAPLALLAACGSPATDAATNTTDVTVPAGNTARTVENLPEGQRTAVFLRAVRDSGQQCQTVTKSEKVSAAGAPPAWQVTCDGGRQWIVAIDAAGTATVTDRAGLDAQGGRTS